MSTSMLLLLLVMGLSAPLSTQAFTSASRNSRVSSSLLRKDNLSTFYSSSRLSGYVSPEEQERLLELENNANSAATTTKSSTKIVPKVGDMVRYYELDGGNPQGQEWVGRITFLTRTASASSGFMAELVPMEDLGDGFFADYPSTQKVWKKTPVKDLAELAPLMSSFVRSEQAYKVPLQNTDDNQKPRVAVRQEAYDWQDWEGPKMPKVDPQVVESDQKKYNAIKIQLFQTTALTGLLGAAGVNLFKGVEYAAIYLAGVLASLAYLALLSLKTDTIGSSGNSNRLGSPFSNLRFFMPFLVLLGVSISNQSRGDNNPMAGSTSPFDTVTQEQFAAAAIGFLTYRVPLYISQLREALKAVSDDEDSDELVLPGSAGIALQLARGASQSANEGDDNALQDEDALVPVLLVSGPQATGRDDLVQELLRVDERLIAPTYVDQQEDGVTFERLNGRGEFLQVDSTGRYGLTKSAILEAGPKANQEAVDKAIAAADGDPNKVDTSSITPKAVVVNADVALAKNLQSSLTGARLVGVWVGLDSVGAFEERLSQQIDQGTLVIPEDETRESVVRARIKEIVNEIDYGLSSGIFEFTILNKDPVNSLKELKEAAGYCFK